MKYTIPQIRLGSTSFLLHAGYLPAIRFGAKHCDDIAIMIMEADNNGDYFVSPKEIIEIAKIAEGEGTQFHVHLPVDVHFDSYESAQKILKNACKVIERTAPLTPHTFVMHVDFCEHTLSEQTPTPKQTPTPEQIDWTADILQAIAQILPAPEYLAIENLEGYPLTFWDRWLDKTPYSRCLDIGHVWKDAKNPVPYIESWFSRIRLIHLHGLQAQTSPKATPKDHTTLQYMPEATIDAVMHLLWDRNFSGLINLEVFHFDHFTSSHAVLMQSWERYSRNKTQAI